VFLFDFIEIVDRSIIVGIIDSHIIGDVHDSFTIPVSITNWTWINFRWTIDWWIIDITGFKSPSVFNIDKTFVDFTLGNLSILVVVTLVNE